MLRTTSSQLFIRQFTTSSPVWCSRRSPLLDNAKSNSSDHISKDPNISPDASFSSTNPTTSGSVPLNTHNPTFLKQRVRKLSDRVATTIRTRADDFTATTMTLFSQLGSHLNRVTGYEEIEALKRQVVEQEARINATRQAARRAKAAHDQAVVQRSNSQREVNDLLQRKSNWTDGDVSRFTTLVRQDHLYEQEEARTKAVADESERAVEREFTELMRSILARYHEEQVWSDKIRSASTYGSLTVLSLNLLVFVMAIVVVEPWKRRRLAQTFEKKVEEISLENAANVDRSTKEISRQLEALSEEIRTARQRSTEPQITAGMAAVVTKDPTPRSRAGELGVIVVASGVIVGVIECLRSWLGS